jgi:hypothetical protein
VVNKGLGAFFTFLGLLGLRQHAKQQPNSGSVAPCVSLQKGERKGAQPCSVLLLCLCVHVLGKPADSARQLHHQTLPGVQ